MASPKKVNQIGQSNEAWDKLSAAANFLLKHDLIRDKKTFYRYFSKPGVIIADKAVLDSPMDGYEIINKCLPNDLTREDVSSKVIESVLQANSTDKSRKGKEKTKTKPRHQEKSETLVQ